jgi:hypothetical protein
VISTTEFAPLELEIIPELIADPFLVDDVKRKVPFAPELKAATL